MPAIQPTAAPDAAISAQTNAFKLQDFLKVLMTQLTYQDPLKPMDNQQFMAQMAQFTQLEQTQQLNTKLDALIATQSALQSVGLIGRQVEVQTDNGVVSATVATLSLSQNAPQLTVTLASGAQLSNIALSQVLSVR